MFVGKLNFISIRLNIRAAIRLSTLDLRFVKKKNRSFYPIVLFRISESVELTFELPDSAKECFYEVIEKDTESTLEFQVRYMLFSLLEPVGSEDPDPLDLKIFYRPDPDGLFFSSGSESNLKLQQ